MNFSVGTKLFPYRFTEVESVMIQANVPTEKFTATADLLVELKSALHTLPLRAKYEPRRLEAVKHENNNHGKYKRKRSDENVAPYNITQKHRLVKQSGVI